MSAFDDADYYDWRRYTEELSYTTVEEALAAMFDDVAGGVSFVEVLARQGPVTITAYRRKAITTSDHHALAIDLRDFFHDRITEDFGDLDGDMPSLDGDAERELQVGLEALIARIIRDHDIQPWQCEEVARREFSPAEVETIMRDFCPEWFEEAEAR